VFTPFRRRRVATEAPTLRSRSESRNLSDSDTDVELKPELRAFLGRFAYLELAAFEALSGVVRDAPGLIEKEAVSIVAGESLDRHQRLTSEILRDGGDPSVVMQPFTAEIDAFRHSITGGSWYESVLSIYLTDGMLADVAETVSAHLPRGYRSRVSEVLEAANGSEILVETLRTGLAADPQRAARLALWGRRIVGDVLLQARASLQNGVSKGDFEVTIAPVLAELIAAHTRRMYSLGLTA
jgi:hypothetical protein